MEKKGGRVNKMGERSTRTRNDVEILYVFTYYSRIKVVRITFGARIVAFACYIEKVWTKVVEYSLYVL